MGYWRWNKHSWNANYITLVFFYSGKCQSQIVANIIIEATIASMEICVICFSKVMVDMAIMIVDTNLAFRGIFPSFKFWIMALIRFWFIRHLCIRGELLSAAHTASNINSVLGKPGRIIPTIPITRLVHASVPNSAVFIDSAVAYHWYMRIDFDVPPIFSSTVN